MKRHLNTLYVTTQDSWLSKDGENIVLKVDGKAIGRLPIHTLSSIVCFGRVSCSQFLMDFCASNGVTICWLTEAGRFMASVKGRTSGNVLLRVEQYRQSTDEQLALHWAKAFITGKIFNCRIVLQRALRDHPSIDEDGSINQALALLKRSLNNIPNASSLDELRGIEGDAAGVYFGVFGKLLTDQVESISFSGRNRRPPLDPVNCLLSFFYTLLANDIEGALESVGLDPQVGYLHRLRPGRSSLALDLEEEFRPVIADRLVLNLLNRGQLKREDFDFSKSGAVLLKENARTVALKAYHQKKQEEVIHPFLNEKISTGLLWHMQARLLARGLRGELKEYPPYIIR